MIKVAVVDDEQKEREGLQEFFHTLQKEVNEEIEVVLFPDGEKLLEGYDASWDLICLDIELGGTDGILIAKKLRKLDSKVILIFVTNMAQMAIRGYEVRALDFLVKPVNYYSFSLKMRSVINMIKRRKNRSIVLQTPGEESGRYGPIRSIMWK